MEPLVIRKGLEISGEFIAVSYVRDLGAEATAEAARVTPTSVELRLDVARLATLDEPTRARILTHPGLRVDRRGTARLVCRTHRSRRANLEEARALLAQYVREAIDDSPFARPPPEPEEPPRRGGRSGLIKRG